MIRSREGSGVAGQKLASALLGRLPALADELLKRVLEQSDVCGKQSEIYGDDRLVPIDDLRQSLRTISRSWSAIWLSGVARSGPPAANLSCSNIRLVV